MTAKPTVAETLDLITASRPREIEPWTNLHLIHPASRALVPSFHRLGLSPNAVSALGALTAALGAACLLWLPWPWNALAGFALLCLRHVLDGADGLLARVSGRASSTGDLIDGLCDAASLIVVQGALAIHLAAEIGSIAYWIVGAGFVSYVLQVNAYEGRRRQYIHWVHDRPMITADPSSDDALPGGSRDRATPVQLLRSLLVRYYSQVAYDSAPLTRDMHRRVAAGGAAARRARSLYGARKRPLVKQFGWLGENQKTIAVGLSMLAGSALYYYVYLAAAMNVFLVALLFWQTRLDRRLCRELAGDGL